MGKMTVITGNTYPVKDRLKAIGAKWNPDSKSWMAPDDRAEEAKQIVASGATASAAAQSQHFVHHKCTVCGARRWNGMRGSRSNGGVIIYRSGECRDCYDERKMGY